ncbi:hypothetical protein GCM10027360_55730 [Amycolatopsis echigonensis]
MKDRAALWSYRAAEWVAAAPRGHRKPPAVRHGEKGAAQSRPLYDEHVPRRVPQRDHAEPNVCVISVTRVTGSDPWIERRIPRLPRVAAAGRGEVDKIDASLADRAGAQE